MLSKDCSWRSLSCDGSFVRACVHKAVNRLSVVYEVLIESAAACLDAIYDLLCRHTTFLCRIGCKRQKLESCISFSVVLRLVSDVGVLCRSRYRS